jgi:hypothetical protein
VGALAAAGAFHLRLTPFSPNSAGHRKGARWPLGFTGSSEAQAAFAMPDRGQATMWSQQTLQEQREPSCQSDFGPQQAATT